MNESERDLVFSQAVKAGKRIYYFDVKQSRNGDRYISITESKKVVEGSYENPRISFEKHKLFLYKEDYEKFVTALTNTLNVAKTGIVPEEVFGGNLSESPNNDDENLKHETIDSEYTIEIKEDVIDNQESVNPNVATEPTKDEEPFKIDLNF